MTFVIDYEFRPGCEYICYLPRLKGAAAIPTLTLRNFRESCSANCVHPWKPKPPPPKPKVMVKDADGNEVPANFTSDYGEMPFGK